VQRDAAVIEAILERHRAPAEARVLNPRLRVAYGGIVA